MVVAHFPGSGGAVRWAEQLASLNYKIVHCPGKQHVNAVALSQLPAFAEGACALPLAADLPTTQQVPVASVCAVKAQEQGPLSQILEVNWPKLSETMKTLVNSFNLRGVQG